MAYHHRTQIRKRLGDRRLPAGLAGERLLGDRCHVNAGQIEVGGGVAEGAADMGTPILDQVVQAGANSIYGISFSVEQPETLLDQARKPE